MRLTIIAAVDRNGAIGRKGDLLYHISADLRRFKELTTGHTVVMGRKTFESLPKGALPNRRNIVITRNAAFAAPGAERAASLEAAIAMGAAGEQMFVIGGGEIYAQAIDRADVLQLTLVEAVTPEADTFFPSYDTSVWRLEEISALFTDEKSGVGYRFATYVRE